MRYETYGTKGESDPGSCKAQGYGSLKQAGTKGEIHAQPK